MCQRSIKFFFIACLSFIVFGAKTSKTFAFDYGYWDKSCNLDSECFDQGDNYCCSSDTAYCNDYISGTCVGGSGSPEPPKTGKCYPGVGSMGVFHTDACDCGCDDSNGPGHCIKPCTSPTPTGPTPSTSITPTPPNPQCAPPNQCVISGACPDPQKRSGSCSAGNECCYLPPPSKDCVRDYGSRGFSCQDEGLNAGESCTVAMSFNGQWRVLSEDITGIGAVDEAEAVKFTREARGSCLSGKDCLRQCNKDTDIPKNMCIININPDNITDLSNQNRYDVQVHNVPVYWTYGEGQCLPTSQCDEGFINYIKMSLNYDPSAGSTGGLWPGINSTGTWERPMGCISSPHWNEPWFSRTRSECTNSPGESAAGLKTNADKLTTTWFGPDDFQWQYQGGKICCDGWREDTADLDHNPMCTTPGAVTGTVSTPNVYSDGLEASVEVVRFRFTISGRQNIVAAPAAMPQGEVIRLHDITPGYGNPIVWAEPPATGIDVANNGDILTHQCTYTVSANRLVWDFECKIPWHQDRIGETRTVKFVTKYNEEGQIDYNISNCTSVCNAPYCGQDDGCGYACTDTDTGQPPKVIALAPGSISQANPEQISSEVATVSFQWRANVDDLTDGYYFAIYDSDGNLNFGQTISGSTTERQTRPTSSFTPEVVYHWQVRAQNTDCTTVESDWSDPKYFVIVPPTQVESWWQILGGHGFATSQINSKVPAGLDTYLIETNQLSLANSAGAPMCLAGPISVNGFYTNRANQISVLGQTGYVCSNYNFTSFKQKLGITASTPVNLDDRINNFAEITDNAINVDNNLLLYVNNSDLTLDPTSIWNVSEKVILVVEGDVLIDNSNSLNELISIGPGGFLGIIASGSVTFSQKVGYSNQLTVNTSDPNWSGLIFADGQVSTESTGDTATDKKLIVKGSYIGCGGVNLNRIFTPEANPLTPTEVFIYDPELAANTPSQLKETQIQWQEGL